MASRKVVGFAARIIVAAVLVAAVSGCGGDGPTPPPGPASVDVTPAGSHRLFNIGETLQLSATPKDAAGNPVSATVIWTSSATNVAQVSSTGLVTATGFGTATIRAQAGGVGKDVSVLVQAAANTVSFNVNANSACAAPRMAAATLEATSARLLIYADNENPPNGFTTSDYEAFAATFESLIWPVLTSNFGTPTDIDNNGRVIALFTRAVNELTPAGSQGLVGGFFFGRDLFPKTTTGNLSGCAASNEAEMFYLLVPDPTGSINDNTRIVADVRRITTGVIGHEMQHLINSATRLYLNAGAEWPETIYMEEGLSHIAEELLFYEASSLAPKMNLGNDEIVSTDQRRDAFNQYMISNAGRISLYLKDPSTNAPYQKDDDLATRGASWSFLRYLADRGSTPLVTEPVCAAPVSLAAAGARCRIDGAAAAQFNVAAGGSVEEFAIVAFAADLPAVGTGPTATDGTMSVTASATSSIAVTGPPDPSLSPNGALLPALGAGRSLGVNGGALQLDYAFHRKLRAMERRELPGRVAGARAAYALRNHPGARTYSVAPAGPSMTHVPVDAVWSQLVGSNDTGIVNLRGRFGQDITGAARNWAVAHYVDDTGLGGIPAAYTHPSWNLRTLLANPAFQSNNQKYPLKVHHFTETVPTLTMTNAGAAYYRLGVAAGGTGTVTFSVNGSTPTDRLKLTIVRTK